MVNFEDVGSRLQTALRAKGYTKLLVFAVELGVSPSTVTRWCNGQPIKLNNLVQICEVLDISMDWLIFGAKLLNPNFPPPQDNDPPDDLADALQGLSNESLKLLAATIRALRETS